MSMIRVIGLVAFGLSLLGAMPAEARRAQYPAVADLSCDSDGKCVQAGARQPFVRQVSVNRQPVQSSGEVQVVRVGAPAGCPPALFCGCDLSLKLFNRIVTTPNLKEARKWAYFPRAQPAPGMVGIGHRRGGGHVLELISQGEGSTWRVYDPNSGGRTTRIHERNIAGLLIVNPRGRPI